MEKYNFNLTNINSGSITEIRSTSIRTIREILKKFESKERENNSVPDELSKVGKKIKAIKHNPIKTPE